MNELPKVLPPGFEGIGIQQPETGTARNTQLGQNEFFALMVAQLQNQDPLKPLESNEFMSQVAQFSTVDGIQRMEKSLSGLANSWQSSQALQASTLVGRDILVAGNQSVLEDGASLRGAAELASSTGQLSVGVFDAAGQLVRRLELGPQPAGVSRFSWDGLNEQGTRAPAGSYRVQAQAVIDDEVQALPTLMVSRVESVTLGSAAEGISLNIKGLGAVAMNQVRELL